MQAVTIFLTNAQLSDANALEPLLEQAADLQVQAQAAAAAVGAGGTADLDSLQAAADSLGKSIPEAAQDVYLSGMHMTCPAALLNRPESKPGRIDWQGCMNIQRTACMLGPINQCPAQPCNISYAGC